MSRLLGYVLSGSTTTEASFEPLESMEDRIREGMMVIINDSGRSLLGTVTRIEMYHEFYEAGSVWAEAIRRNQLPPSTAARRYTIARVQLQGVLSNDGLGSVGKPPRPGSKVYEAETHNLRVIYGYEPGKDALPPNMIEVGSLYGYHQGVPAVLDLSKLTMHIAVLGVTGSGKSNTVGVIIEELGKKDKVTIGAFEAKTIPMLVFDANGDYNDYYENPMYVSSYHVMRLVFPKAYEKTLLTSDAELEEIVLDLNVFYDRLADLVEAIYALTRGGSLEGLELQLDFLTRVLLQALDDDTAKITCPNSSGGVDLNCLLVSDDGLEILMKIIDEEEKAKTVHGATVGAVKRALMTFKDRITRYRIIRPSASYATLNKEFVKEITDPNNPKLVIVDFSPDGAPGVDLRTKQFIVYYMLKLLFDEFVRYKIDNENRVMLVVIEEAQNYAPNQREYPIGFSVARSMLALVATQGRKFGLSLALVTQRPGFVDPVIMSMMNTFLVHRVSPGDVRFIQLATGGLPKHIASKLSSLETGLAILVGQMNPFPYPVLTKIRKRRSHRAGSI